MYALFDRKGTSQRKSKSMAKSSINFAKATSHSEEHNLRKDEPSYLLPKEHRLENEIWQHEKKESELFSKSAAKQKTGRKPKFENSRWEAIINFNKNHSLGDLKKVSEHIEKKFNITCTSIAMHKDEGHLNERGVPIYNLHAHVNFITHKDGKQNWRKEFIKPADLRELQTEVAELLGMERGTDKRISKKERLEHRQFKATQQELAKQKDLKAEIAEIRAELKESKATRSDYAELEAFSKELKEQVKAKDLTIDELKHSVNTWRNKSTNWEEAKTYKELYEEIKEEKEELEAKISNLKPLDVEMPQKSDKIDLKAISEELGRTNQVKQYDKTMLFENLDKFAKEDLTQDFVKLVKEKGTYKEPSKLNRLKETEVTLKLNDLKQFMQKLEDTQKLKEKLLESAKELMNKFEKPLNAIKSYVYDHFIKPRAEEKMKERQKERTLEREQSKDRGMEK